MSQISIRPDNRRPIFRKGLLGRFVGALGIITGLGLGGMAFSVQAQTIVPGMDRALLAKELKDKHSEKPVGMGLGSNGGIIELFTSDDGATWTLIMTMPNGRSFLVGAGEHWNGAPVTAKGEKI